MKAVNYLEIYMNQAEGSANQLLELALEFQKQDLDNYSLTCFEKALTLAPNSSTVHKYLGYFYLEKNNKIKAEDHFVLSYELNNKQPDVAYELGLLGVQVQIPRQAGANRVSIN
jgi:Tfp pilus assembly protein PilF